MCHTTYQLKHFHSTPPSFCQMRNLSLAGFSGYETHTWNLWLLISVYHRAQFHLQEVPVVVCGFSGHFQISWRRYSKSKCWKASKQPITRPHTLLFSSLISLIFFSLELACISNCLGKRHHSTQTVQGKQDLQESNSWDKYAKKNYWQKILIY